MAAEYSVNLPEDLKASLISEIEGSWDSEYDEGHGGDATPTNQAREQHGSVSSESSDTKSSSEPLGARLKKIITPGLYCTCPVDIALADIVVSETKLAHADNPKK